MDHSFSFGWESVASLLSDPATLDLIEQQYAEFAHYPDEVPLDLDIERMRKAEGQGAFKMWAARYKHNLAGYIAFQIVSHINYRSTLFAMDCGHFLDPRYRTPWLWLAMWRSAFPELKNLGVKVVIAHDNAVRPIPAGFKRLGFSPDGRNYTKVI